MHPRAIIAVCFTTAALVAACSQGSETPTQLRANRVIPLLDQCTTKTSQDEVFVEPCNPMLSVAAHASNLKWVIEVFDDDGGNDVTTVSCSGTVSGCVLHRGACCGTTDTVFYNTCAAGSGTIRVNDLDTTYHIQAHSTAAVTAS